MRELLFGFQLTAWLLALVFGAQLCLATDEQIVAQAMLTVPYAVLAASALSILGFFYERWRTSAESEVSIDRLRRKNPELFGRPLE